MSEVNNTEEMIEEVAEEVVVNLDEINAKYEEKGFFKRFKEMVSGLGKPHDTREYKIARLELQRLAAPLIAFVSVALFIVVLIVMTAVSGQSKKVIEVQIAEVEEEEPELEDEIDEPPPDDIEPPPEEIDIPVDLPNPGPVSQITPQAAPPSAQPVSVKPAPQDSVAIVNSPIKMKSMVGSRTPGSIGEATRGGAGYGDATTEACVMKVLWWLKHNQAKNGAWAGGNQLANAAFAVLTFLSHGEYPGAPSPYRKDFGPVVQRAIDYIISCATPNDPVNLKGTDGHLYAFTIATYALCEAYGMTKNPNCKDLALRCMDRIIKGQNPTGGWDYTFKKSDRDDLSLGGWALQALKAGKMAGLHPEGLDACIKKAVNCLTKRNFKNNGSFTYTADGGHPGLTATGCLAMQLLGYGNQNEVSKALDFMREWHPSFDQKQMAPNLKNHCPSPQYYSYYATQCKYQAGMKPGASKADTLLWQKWNAEMKKLYPSSIIDAGKTKDWSGKEHKMGHFKNNDQFGKNPTMDSCFVALQLMVYYRYLPTTQVTAGEVEETGGAEAAVDKASDVSVEVDI